MTSSASLCLALRESFLTTITRPWRLVLAVLMSGLILAAPATFEMAAVDVLTDTLEDERERGTSVLVVESESGSLDGRRCASVAAQDGVAASGGVTAPTVAAVSDPVLTTVRAVRATAGYFEIMWDRPPHPARPFALLGSDLARELSFATGSPLLLGNEGPLAAYSAPRSLREASRGRWITIPAADLRSVQQCWIETTSASLSAVRAALPAYFPGAPGLQVTALRGSEITDAALAAWAERASRWMYLVCGAVGGLVVGTLVASRRPEYALYRLLGMSRTTVLVIATVEAMLLLQSAGLFAGLACMGALSALDPVTPADLLSVLLNQVAVTAAVAGVAAGLACVLLTSGNPAHTIRSHR